jgi:phage-related protein
VPVYSSPFTITAPPAANAGLLMINNTNARTLGFVLESASGWLDVPSRTRATVVRPARAGAYPSAATQEGPRKLSLAGTVMGSTADEVRANIDALRALLLSVQPAVISFPDSPLRYVSAYLDQYVTEIGAGPSMIAKALRARIDLSLLEPYAYDIDAQAIPVAAGINRAPLGTAPSFPVITIAGAAVNPVLSLYRYDGTLLGTLGLALTTVAGDSLVIDMDRKTITKNGASVLAALASGDFFALDPVQAQLGLGSAAGFQGYVTVSSGAGTMSYRRAWR